MAAGHRTLLGDVVGQERDLGALRAGLGVDVDDVVGLDRTRDELADRRVEVARPPAERVAAHRTVRVAGDGSHVWPARSPFTASCFASSSFSASSIGVPTLPPSCR